MIQEVIVTKAVLLLSGYEVVDWNAFEPAVRLFSKVFRRYFRQLSSGERDFDGSKIHKFVPRGINGK